jgi:hypothetical protein
LSIQDQNQLLEQLRADLGREQDERRRLSTALQAHELRDGLRAALTSSGGDGGGGAAAVTDSDSSTDARLVSALHHKIQALESLLLSAKVTVDRVCARRSYFTSARMLVTLCLVCDADTC